MKINYHIIIPTILIAITLFSCNQNSGNLAQDNTDTSVLTIVKDTSSFTKSAEVKHELDFNDLNFSFEFISLGGKGILQSNDTKEEIIKTKENKDTIEINVYKWLGVPLGSYKGKCELKSDTLYIYYWEEIKEMNRNSARAAVILQSQLKYKIRKVKYKNRVVKLKDVDYVK